MANFLVERSANAGTSWITVTTVTATAATAYSTTNTGLSAGTYVYRVTARNNAWAKAAAGVSNARTIIRPSTCI